MIYGSKIGRSLVARYLLTPRQHKAELGLLELCQKYGVATVYNISYEHNFVTCPYVFCVECGRFTELPSLDPFHCCRVCLQDLPRLELKPVFYLMQTLNFQWQKIELRQKQQIIQLLNQELFPWRQK